MFKAAGSLGAVPMNLEVETISLPEPEVISPLKGASRPILSAGLGLIVPGLIFVVMSIWSWRKWPDIFVDFGSQLYFPWQIAAGRDLYHDLEYIGGGPLSQYYHALLFKCFNVSLTTLVISSLAILGALTLFIYGLFRKIADMWTATAVVLVFLLFFAFSEYVWVGNYNYVCAYSTEAVHGLVISLVTLVLLGQWLSRGRPAFAFAAGVGFGLVFLTKPDLFLAMGLTLGVTLVLALRLRNYFPPHFGVRSGMGFVAGAVVPLSISVFFFSRNFEIGRGLRATTAAWISLLNASPTKTPFYQWCMGLDFPLKNLGTTLLWFVGYAIAVAAAAWCCCQFSRRQRLVERVVIGLALAGLVVGSIDLPWAECGWFLPLATVSIALQFGWTWWKRCGDPQTFRSIAPILWSTFALFLLSKMILHSRIWHYGFYLAMPAMLINVYYLLWWLPEQLRGRGMQLALFRSVVCIILGIGACRLVSHSNGYYTLKTYPVGPSADRIFTFPSRIHPRAEGIVETAKWLDQHTASNATLAVLPDGLILNYLVRRPNPTRYSSVNPLELKTYGEETMLNAYRAHSPDYIVLMHRSSEEFGVGYFGQDPANGAAFMQWIQQNYDPAWLCGSEPLQTNQFGIKVLKLKKAIAEPLRRAEN
jgi:hypothetical protein